MLVVLNSNDLVEHGIVCLLYCLLIGPYILSILFKPECSHICGILNGVLSQRKSVLFILSLLPGNLLLLCKYIISLIDLGFAEQLSLSRLSSLALLILAIALHYFLLTMLSIALSLLLCNLSLLFLTLLLFSISLLSPDVFDRRQKYLVDHSLVVLHCSQLFATADATPERESRLAQIRACRRVRYSKRAVDSAAVPRDWVTCLVVAPLAEVGRAKAVEHCYRAAIVAFPVDLLAAMFLAVARAGSVGFHLAIFAS